VPFGIPAIAPGTLFQDLSGDTRVDVTIIGGGYSGLSSAYYLKTAEPDLQVSVLEAEHIGFGASGCNAGFVMALF
jgi:glycine/D-amino acid oxidase-like deaminating enzyme